MLLTVGSNTFLTMLEADALLSTNMHAAGWFSLKPYVVERGVLSKATLLTTSYNEITSSPAVSVEASSTDVNVKKAQAEMALFLLDYYDAYKERRAFIAGGGSEFQYSKRKEEFHSDEGGGDHSLPQNVLGLLRDYLTYNSTVELKA